MLNSNEHGIYRAHKCKNANNWHFNIISMMNTTSERFKARNFFICRYLSPCFLKKASGILQSPLSVRPSRYLLLNHWTKSNQIWCVSCSHEWGVQRHFFPPLPGEGPKGQISLNIIKFQLLGRFQRFLNQTLCVLSQMKDIKHIRQDFYLAASVMSQGWDLGVPWGVGGSKKFFFPEIQPDLVCELLS